jgi:hypothetical protein
MIQIARLFLILGLIFLVIGGLIYLAAHFNLPLGRLPGDIRIQGRNMTCLIPIATTILLSVILTLLLNLIIHLGGRK